MLEVMSRNHDVEDIAPAREIMATDGITPVVDLMPDSQGVWSVSPRPGKLFGKRKTQGLLQMGR